METCPTGWQVGGRYGNLPYSRRWEAYGRCREEIRRQVIRTIEESVDIADENTVCGIIRIAK